MTKKRIIVFSDLDGTLLDHETYDWSPARPALEVMKKQGIPLILASSKTAAEIAPLRAAMGFDACPAIVENGAGLLESGAAPDAAGEYVKLRAGLDALPAAVRAPFTGFGDLDVAEVAALTGLPQSNAALAKARGFSEPGVWNTDMAKAHGVTEADFIAALADMGIRARMGGRYLTLSFGATKADRMTQIAAQYGADTMIALGDAPNDIEMLAAADIAVVISNPHGAPLPDLPKNEARRTIISQKAGPSGWNAVMLGLTSEQDEQ
ncbi:mannosyl-3-phosphoglycerate phosphatase [Rhodobacterales bacterium 59_46_T64]|nr:mannosyl-3-phosphoglycerate phosphatase [Rhodobacterales bacterium 59_46_T64]